MFEELSRFFDAALGLGLENDKIGVWQMSLRALVVFVAAIVMLKIGDKRFMGRSTALDAALGIIYGSVVSRAITGNAPFGPTLAAALVLVLLHWLLAAIAFRSHGFGKMVKGHNRKLVVDGELQWDEMKKAHVTESDLHEALRNQGKPPDLSKVKDAYLERNGEISIIARENG